MSKVRLTGSNSGYVEITAVADAGNLTFNMPTSGTALLGNGHNVYTGITTFNGTTIFNDDVTFDGATSGYDVVWDRSDNALEFAANTKATFGNSQDMQLFHDGNHGYINDAGAGNLRLRSGTLEIQNLAGSKTSAVFSSGGGQTLNFNNSAKFVTTNTGAIVTGICTATSFSGDGSNLTGLSTPLSNRNLIINGAMLVDQRGDYSTNSSNASRQYGGPDRFHQYYYQSDETARYTFKQGGTGVSPVEQGFSRTAILDVTTAQATVDITAGQAIWTSQRIEANNASHLKYGHSDAESVTLSFWIKSSVIGNYSITYGHTNMDERYITTYTVNVADTWEKKIITIPGDTRSGKTIAATNGYGLEVKWVWMSGSSRVATPNQWATQGNVYGASGVTLANIFSSASNNLYLTGVQLEIGTTATPFEHRSFTDEELLCQRYFWKYPASIYGCAYGGSGFCHYSLPVRMRIKGALSYTGIRTTSGFYDYSSAQLLQIQMSSTVPYITNPQLDSEL